MKSEFQSCVQGEAVAIFGGRVGLTVGTLTDSEPAVYLGFIDLLEMGEIGGAVVNDGRDDAITFVFTNPKSIDSVIDCLQLAKKILMEEQKI